MATLAARRAWEGHRVLFYESSQMVVAELSPPRV